MTARPEAGMPSGRSGDLLVGVDVGGSKIAALVVDSGLAVRGRTTVPTPVGAPDHAAERIASAIRAALADAGASLDRVSAVGVGVPGRVDPVAGVVSLAVNLDWHRLPLRDRLQVEMGVPCGIENDVRAAAAGTLDRGLLGDVADFVFLGVGTGISAGVVLGGRVHRGIRGLAGEVGHVVVDADGARCPCGLRGCLEAIAAGPAVARAASEALAAGRGSSLAAEAEVDAVAVYRAATAGDDLALEVVGRAGRALARAIHALVMTYDVERVVLGGGVSGAGAAFAGPILAELAAMRAASELAAEMLPEDFVAISPDGPDAGVWGGVSIARRLATAADDRSEEVVARQATA
ncbi:MAG TPA: ROK family protein [Candidatus Limnocylindrales bacterium]|nr:ROK family protein [Candidatus Limnocylindrales bacterium]